MKRQQNTWPINETAKEESIELRCTALGYGGYWSIVAQYGMGYQDERIFVAPFEDEARLKQTTGNALTAYVTAEAIREAIAKLRAKGEIITLAAIGINGNICNSAALSLLKNEHQDPRYHPLPYTGELIYLPIPEDFPVTWTTADEQRLLWELDTHYVKPRKALDDLLIDILIDHFLIACNDVYKYPFKVKSWVINNSLYGAYSYDLGLVPEEGIKRYMAILEPVMLNLMDIWETEWLPEIKQHLAYWDAFDLSNASMPALLEHWAETIRRQHICWNIRLRIFMPIMLGRDIFHQTYQSLFPDATLADSCALLLAYGRNTKYDRGLWALSRELMASPKLYPLIASNSPNTVMNLLDDSAECRAFKQKLADFSLIYGKRGERGTLVTKTINPAPLLEILQYYFTQPEDYLEKQIQAWEIERNQRLQSVREKLQSHPKDAVEKFERHLKMTENANQLRELNNEWIDVPSMNYFREVVQEFARRLTKKPEQY